MKHPNVKCGFSILDGIAGALNACGSALVFSHDICVSGFGKIVKLAKKTSRVSDLFRPQKRVMKPQEESTQPLREFSKNGYRLSEPYQSTSEEGHQEIPKRAEPAQRMFVRSSQQEIKAEGALPRELTREVKETITSEIPKSLDKAAGEAPGVISSKMKKTLEPSRSLSITLDAKRLEKMVKPQLLTLCKKLNIYCNYTDTKAQLIAKILKSQGQ